MNFSDFLNVDAIVLPPVSEETAAARAFWREITSASDRPLPDSASASTFASEFFILFFKMFYCVNTNFFYTSSL